MSVIPAIEAHLLRKRYRSHEAVRDATFTVDRGRVCALLGPNGAGKTTTLRMTLGLVTPTAGHVRVLGRAMRAHSQPASVVGAVFERSTFHPDRSARDHLRLCARLAGLAEERVDAALVQVGLTASARRAVGEFSLGMRQRLAVGAALLGQPDVLVLDEPANGLDPDGVRWLRELVLAHASDGGTVLISSHVLAEVELVADHAVIMADGLVVAAGPLSELNPPAVRVRSPEAPRLAQLLQRAGAHVETRPDDTILATGCSTSKVGDLANSAGVAVHELTARSSLEELYLRVRTESTCA